MQPVTAGDRIEKATSGTEARLVKVCPGDATRSRVGAVAHVGIEIFKGASCD